MSLTVRQVGQHAPALREGVEKLAKTLDGDDEIIKFVKPTLRANAIKLQAAGNRLRTIEADKNSLRATLAQLDDATSSFEEHDVHKQAVMVQNLQSCVERIGATQSLTNSIVLEIPHPYFQVLARDYENQLAGLKKSIAQCEHALHGYQKERQEATSTNEFQETAIRGRKLEIALRANYSHFRAIASSLVNLEHRIEALKNAAQTHKGVNIRSLLLAGGPVSDEAQAQRIGSVVAGFHSQMGGSSGSTAAFGVAGAMQNGAAGGSNMLGGSLGTMGGAGNPMNQQQQQQPVVGGGLFGGQNVPGSNLLLGGQVGNNANPNPQGGLFGGGSGNTNTNNATGGSLFGNTQAQAQGVNTGSSLFGNTTTNNNAAGGGGGGLFGTTTTGTSGLFGNNNNAGGNTSGGGLFGNTGGGGGGGGLFGGGNTGGSIFGAK